MNRIESIFRKKAAFIGFVVAGHGGLDYCIECCLQLIEGGVDILEIGFPFSDPVADGPVIQRAAQKALEQGTTSATLLAIARAIRKKSQVPLILFTYYNPLLKRGEPYFKELKSAGFDAVLVVDLPTPQRDQGPHPHYEALKTAGLHPIFLATPSTDEQRLAEIAAISEGFLYYACQKGTTGVRNKLPEDLVFQISRIKQKTALPIAIGFGIADRDNAEAAMHAADGFIVGSAFVKLMDEGAEPAALKLLAQSIDPRKEKPIDEEFHA